MNGLCFFLLLGMALAPTLGHAQSLNSGLVTPATGTSPVTPTTGTATEMAPIIVTGFAGTPRPEIDLSAGTSSYTISEQDIQEIAQGENTTFNQILVRTPGVSDDTFGAIHFRNEDPFYRYYVNGTLLPSGINGFEQDIDTRFVQSVTTKIGTLPAYYPEGNYGIVDIQTKTGSTLDGGEASVYGGSYGSIRPTFSYGGTDHGTDFYFTGSYYHDDLGLENTMPGTNPIHDETNQYRGMTYLSHVFDGGGRLSFLFSGVDGDFQIPNTPGQAPSFSYGGTTIKPTPVDSTSLNERQNEQTYTGFIAYQQTFDDFSVQISQTDRDSTVKFVPDENGDLYYNGVVASVNEYILVNGLQADFSYNGFTDHTIRFGTLAETQGSGATTSTTYYDVDGAGDPTGKPLTTDDAGYIRAYDYAVYLQDEWQVTKELTINYGLRFEQVKAYTNESQWSPRINAVYQIDKATAVHGGWARYFDTPDLLNISPATVTKFDGTTNAADQDTDDPVKAEKSDYFDVGVTRDFIPGLQAGLDAYYKLAKDQLDDGQFGAANISSPYNIGTASEYGAEFSLDYSNQDFTAYANFSVGDTWGKGIVSSQFEFDADELAASNNNSFRFDQSQYYTASFGAAYKWEDTNFHIDMLYGDGIRAGFVNQGKLDPYYPVNLGLAHDFKIPHAGVITARFDVLNVFDQVYVLNDGTGIGEGAVKYGNRRGFYGGLSYSF